MTHRASRRRTLQILSIALVLLGLFSLDWLAGTWHETATIRRTAQLFRSEVGPLRPSTKYIVPNLAHAYKDPSRSPADTLVPPGSSRLFRTDSRGAILDGTLDPPPPQGLEILFLGGSTTESNEVDEPYRFPTMVGRQLSKQLGRPIRGLNGGVRSHTTQDSLNLLLNHPSYGYARVVVLMHNINDRLLLAIRGHYKSPLTSSGPTSFAAVREAGASFLSASWDFLSYRSNLLFMTRTSWEFLNPWTGLTHRPVVAEWSIDYPDPHPEESLRLFEHNLAIFTAAVRAQGNTPVLMTQPLGRPSPGQQQFNDAIRSVSDHSQVTLIDLDAELPSDRAHLFFNDGIHFNNQGSLAVADLISRHLSSMLGNLPPPAPTGPSRPLQQTK